MAPLDGSAWLQTDLDLVFVTHFFFFFVCFFVFVGLFAAGWHHSVHSVSQKVSVETPRGENSDL